MAVTPALLGFPDKIGVAGWIVIAIFVLASIAGSAGMYGYFLRPLGAALRAVHMAAALAGIAYVFNQDNTMLAVFFGLLAVGTVTPMIANMRERGAGIAS